MVQATLSLDPLPEDNAKVSPDTLAELIRLEIARFAQPKPHEVTRLVRNNGEYTHQFVEHQGALKRIPAGVDHGTFYHQTRQRILENELVRLAHLFLKPQEDNQLDIMEIVKEYALISQDAGKPDPSFQEQGDTYFANETIYSAARDFILDGIKTSSQEHSSEICASDGYRNWLGKRLRLLAPLSRQTGHDKENSKEIARHAREEYGRLVEEVAPRIAQRFQQLNAAFAKAATVQEAVRAYKWLTYAVDTYSRVLGVDKKEVKKEAEKKLDYLITRDQILEVIEDSFRNVPVDERASNQYIGWLEKRLEFLAAVSKKTAYGDENSEELTQRVRNQNIQAIHEQKVGIRNQQGAVLEVLPFTQLLHRQFQQLANIFMGAETPDDAMHAYMPLVDLANRHSIVLGIDQEKFDAETKKKLAFFGLEVTITQSPHLNADERGYGSNIIQTGIDEQTGTDNAPNSSAKRYSTKNANNGSKNGNSLTEKVVTTLAGIGAVAALVWGAYQWHERPEPTRMPTLAEQVETLPRSNGMPGAAEEAAYVNAFHHTAQERGYLDLRRAGWCPTREVLTKLVRPYDGTEKSWDETHARRAELLKIFASDPTYACRR